MPNQTVTLKKDWVMGENVIPAGSKIVVKAAVAAELKASGIIRPKKKRKIKVRRKSNAIS